MPTEEQTYDALKYNVEITPSGARLYYNHLGQLHREDGPAVIQMHGRKEWWSNGLRHREDGPAVMYPNGTSAWFRNGLRHREDGPAIIWTDGSRYWYLNGTYYSETAHRRAMQQAARNF